MSAFFTGIAEVLGGLLQLFGDFETDPTISPEELARLNTWDRQTVNGEFAYSIRPDSTVLLDANQRLKKLDAVLNMTAKSGYVNPEPIIREMLELSGVDPEKVMVKPQPTPPEDAKVALSFKGEDLSNPISGPFIAGLMVKQQQAPTPQEVEAGKQLLFAAAAGSPNAPAEAQEPGSEFLPKPSGGGPQPHAADQQPTPPLPGDAFPDWEANSRINTRRAAGEGHGKV